MAEPRQGILYTNSIGDLGITVVGSVLPRPVDFGLLSDIGCWSCDRNQGVETEPRYTLKFRVQL